MIAKTVTAPNEWGRLFQINITEEKSGSIMLEIDGGDFDVHAFTNLDTLSSTQVQHLIDGLQEVKLKALT